MPTAPAPSPRIIRSKRRAAADSACQSLLGRWHGAAVTDEGLASPYGRGAPGRGGEGVFYPLSHFVTAPPEWEPRGDCDRRESLEGHTSDVGRLLAKTRINCRFSCRGGQWPPAFYADFQRKWAANGRPYLFFRRFSENCMRPHPALRATCTLRYDCHRQSL